MRVMALTLGLLLLGAACSDDNQGGPKQDTGTDTLQYTDTGLPDSKPDAPAADLGPDAPGSDARPDAPAPDASKDAAALEASTPPDKGNDIKFDLGNPLIWGYISRSVLPVNDGVGNIHIAVSQVIWPFPPIAMASKVIKRADLSKAGTKIKYQVNATVAAGTYVVSAWMDDNNNVWSPLAIAAAGDLVMSKTKSVKTGSSAVQVDMVLDKVSALGGPDGGTASTALKGKVTAKVVPAADGKGRLFFSLHTKVPPAGLVSGSGTMLAGCDLSTPFLSEAYYYNTVKAGKYYLQAWLDDNGNANTLLGNPVPDKGDMITAKGVQVHVVNGQVSVSNVVLDALKK